MDKKPRVVAVIPCYNTAPHIAEVHTSNVTAEQEVNKFEVVDGIYEGF